MNKIDKIKEGMTLIEVKEHYRPLEKPMVEETARKVRNIITELYQKKHIDEMTLIKMVVSNTEPSTHSSFLHSYKNTQGQLVKSTNNLWMRFPYWENFSFCWQSPSTNNERTAVIH